MTGSKRIKLQVRDLVKYFDSLLVLDKLSFDVYDGELLCIVGPTGCGKTTLLNIISRLIPFSSGQILIEGEEVDVKKHNIAYIFQEPSYFPWLTVYSNILFGFERGDRKNQLQTSEVRARIERLMKLTGLERVRNYYPHEISSSAQQLMVIARAFAVEPDLLLMDEPYGQLDVNVRLKLEEELLRIWRELRKTIIFVTHNIEEAVYLAERIIVLTQKPTRVKDEVIVDMQYPRDITDPKFLEIKKRVIDLIKWWKY
jgi:ABC-type nitrate/sulfonate/bicarbonate transport system ATPase subunit